MVWVQPDALELEDLEMIVERRKGKSGKPRVIRIGFAVVVGVNTGVKVQR